jgi:ATP-dependent exoDNAse (exonuclease V) beta subunit
MTTAPNDQQARDAIRTRLDETLFVEAGAGTGKTTELVQRILALVTSGVPVRQIAAITFTEAAAAELKDRVRQELEGASLAAPGYAGLRGPELALCATALDDLDAASMQTLHSFAQRILMTFPLEAGLPPEIQLMDDIRSRIAFDERWGKFLDVLLANPAYESALVRGLTLGLATDGLKQVARAFHENWDRLDHAVFDQPDEGRGDFDAAPLAAELAAVTELQRHALTAEDRLCQHLDRVRYYAAALDRALGEVSGAEEGAGRGAAEDRLLRLLADGTPIETKYGQMPNWRGIKPGEIRATLKQLSTVRDELLGRVRSHALAGLLPALVEFALTYAGERRRDGRLDFQDLLVLARNVLREHAEVREALATQYVHVLIDEFQDTDPLQAEIAALLACEADAVGPWHALPPKPGKLFVVGDPKQSIYRFRRADVELYEGAREAFQARTVLLTTNFRSVPPILDWVNAVFERLFELRPGEPEHAQPRYIALDGARPDVPPPVVRLIGEGRDAAIDEIRRGEGDELVRLIQAARRENWRGASDPGQTTRYADMTILLPTRTTFPPIERALEAAGIPYRVESRSLLFATQEIRDLTSILAAIDDPTDDIAVVAALRAPAFACGDDDLVRFSKLHRGWDYRAPSLEALDPADPVVRAMAILKQYHDRRWWMPVSTLVEEVIRERRMLELAFAGQRPRETWQRLRFVVEQARQFVDAGSAISLRQFVDWLRTQAEEGSRVAESVVPEADDDAVRVMTVHASKGLEFPIVFLAGLGADPMEIRPPVLWRASADGDRFEVHIGYVRSPFKTAGYDTDYQNERTMSTHEKNRLLYVAATRAKDALVVSLHHKASNVPHEMRHMELRCAPAECITAICNELGLTDRVEVPEIVEAHPETVEDTAAETRESRDGWVVDRKARIQSLARAPRLAATAIAHAGAAAAGDEKPEPEPEAPPWRRGRAGTSIGRAVHAVLQTIGLKNGDGEVEAARAQAVAEGIPGREEEIALLVRNARQSKAVRAALASKRYWREVYVAAEVGGGTVEGFIDLLYESPEGLVVVDYKTDEVPGAAAIEAAMGRYSLQGAAYAVALEAALGRPVARCTFVFVRPRGEHDIPDLPAAMRQVKERVPELLAAMRATP